MSNTIQTATQKIRSNKEELLKDGIDLGGTSWMVVATHLLKRFVAS